MTSESSVDDTVAAVVEQLGPPTVVCNVAGIGGFYRTEEMPLERWEQILAVNLTGPFLVCRATLPHLLEHGGSIVNVASNTALMGQSYSAAYCASKAGLLMFSKALAAEYLSRGVRVNVVAPGGVDTPLIGKVRTARGGGLQGAEQDHDADGVLHPGRDRRLGGLHRLRRVVVHHRGGPVGRRRADHLTPEVRRRLPSARSGTERAACQMVGGGSGGVATTRLEEPHDRCSTGIELGHRLRRAQTPSMWPTRSPSGTNCAATCPVAHTDRRGSTWLPTRYQDVVDLAHDIDHFSSTEIAVIPFAGERPEDPVLRYGLPPISADPPLHTWTRRLLLPWFSHRRVEGYEPMTRTLCAGLVDGFVADGRPTPPATTPSRSRSG